MKNEGKVWIGFDLGGTKMLSVAYDDKWNVVGRRRRKTRGRDGGDSGVSRIASTIERLMKESDLSMDDLAGIGIGCPGPIDLDKGKILMAPNLGWTGIDLSDNLKKRFGCETVVLNDVDAGVFGEYKFGSAKGARCAIGIFPGTGVGGGCIYDGKIFQGAGISCMEIGHTRISSGSRASGLQMTGTVEAEASRLAIAAEASKAAFRGDAPQLFKTAGTDVSEIRSGVLADSVASGDEAIRDLVEQAARTIGFAVVNMVHLMSPDKIVLGGGLVEAMEELFLGTVRKVSKQHVMDVYKDRFEIVAAKLGDDAGVIGAAAWAKQQIAESAEKKATLT